MNALSTFVADRAATKAGRVAAETNTYNPDNYLRGTLPALITWDPAHNPIHKEINAQLELEVDEETTVSFRQQQHALAPQGSAWPLQLLLAFMMGVELLSAVGLCHELGCDGFLAVPLGELLGSTIFFLVGELR